MVIDGKNVDLTQPEFAIALLVGTRGGLALNYQGIRRFDLSETSLEKVIDEVSCPKYEWKEPVVGTLTTALSIANDKPLVTLIFVLAPNLQAQFASKPILAGCERAQKALRDIKLWPQPSDTGGPQTVSVTADSRNLEGEGDVKFSLAVDNIGVLEKQSYRTPIFIDPEWPYPPTGGGVGGGGPP
jgi:hypothetical protein